MNAATQDFDLDLFVIGAGSGGVRAARIAAIHGAKVKIAEEYRVGGTCVIRGCVPKKLMVYAGRFAHDFEDAAGFGWTVNARFDWSTLIANKDKEIARLEGAYVGNLERNAVDIIRQRAVIEGPHTVRLADGTIVTARYILIATGAYPNLGLAIPGRELAISSNEIFDLKTQPKSIVIQGGGYIALEFASLLAGLGTKVTLVHRGDKVLRGFDEEIRERIGAELAANGVTFKFNASIDAIEETHAGRHVVLSDGTSLEADQVMLAIGRTPNTTGLGLDKVGVAVDSGGSVVVTPESRTTIPSIYAVGDVTDRMPLTPIAIREGHAFADSVFGDKPWTVDYSRVPTAVFTEPEIGTVGLSEQRARNHGHRIDIYKTSFRPLKATLSGRRSRVFMKLVVDQPTDRVLGVHIIGADAGEMVQVVGVAISANATKGDFDRTVALHPSTAEELVTLRTKDPSSDPPEPDDASLHGDEPLVDEDAVESQMEEPGTRPEPVPGVTLVKFKDRGGSGFARLRYPDGRQVMASLASTGELKLFKMVLRGLVPAGEMLATPPDRTKRMHQNLINEDEQLPNLPFWAGLDGMIGAIKGPWPSTLEYLARAGLASESVDDYVRRLTRASNTA